MKYICKYKLRDIKSVKSGHIGMFFHFPAYKNSFEFSHIFHATFVTYHNILLFSRMKLCRMRYNIFYIYIHLTYIIYIYVLYNTLYIYIYILNFLV